VKALILLADAAQVQGGKLYILGGGWSQIGPEPTPTAIVLRFEVPWAQANQRHHWELSLVDADGKGVLLPTPEGEQPLVLSGDLEVGRPAGLTPGIDLEVPVAINLAPLPLPPDGRYRWQLSIAGETREEWQASFSTRPLLGQQGPESLPSAD
jgi:hypothetical protein